MESSPFTTPLRQPSIQDATTSSSSPPTRDFSQIQSSSHMGMVTPAPSARTDVPLLPTNYPVTPLQHYDEKHKQTPRWRRAINRINELLLGRETASVYWYASLLSVVAALIVTLSSIFGWPPLPIWEYLRHATG